MAILPNDAPEDFRAKVWEQMYERLFDGLISSPSAEEMYDGLIGRKVMRDGTQKPLTREMIFQPAPRGWVWDRFNGDDRKDWAGREIQWIGIDFAEGYKPIRLPTEEDRAVHRAIAAMQRPTRAHEL